MRHKGGLQAHKIKINQFRVWRFHGRLLNISVLTTLLPMSQFELHALLTATHVTSTNNCHICPKKPKPSRYPCLCFFKILKRKAQNCTTGLDWGLYISPSKHFMERFMDHCSLYNHVGIFWQCFVMEDIHQTLFTQPGRQKN